MPFTTKIDFSNNRQVKQRIETIQNLSGGTTFGVPFSALPSGPDLTTSGITLNQPNVVSTFSGNSATTVYTWYDNNMALGEPYLSALTPSNTGITQNTGLVFTASSTTIIDGNTVNLAYTGVSFDLGLIALVDLGGGVYTGTVTTFDFDTLSAGTLDFTGRTIWSDTSGITRTESLIITENPVPGNVWTCIDIEGRGAWTVNSSASTSSYWTSGSGTDAIIVINSNSIASGKLAVAIGSATTASGLYSHSEGFATTASGYTSHAEGVGARALGVTSHAEGNVTLASGTYSHAEGASTTASGMYSHAEGSDSKAFDWAAHAEGFFTTAIGVGAHSEGRFTTAMYHYTHAEGDDTTASGLTAHAEGLSTTAIADAAHAEGQDTTATGDASHAEGYQTWANGITAHAEGYQTTAQGDFGAHAEGGDTTAIGAGSHAEGGSTVAIGIDAHSEGAFTTAGGDYSHAGGNNSLASGDTSFIHSRNSYALGARSAVIGGQNLTGTTDDYVYVPSLNINVVGATANVNDILIDANGNLTTNTSDIRLKENINNITGALDKIKQLQGVTYQWIDRSAGGDAVKLGFIAQSVEEVEPRLVFTSKGSDIKGIHMNGIIPLLVEAVKELVSGTTTINNTHLETQTVVAEDNNIDLNFNGNEESAVGGGISVLHALGDGESAKLITDENGDWITNNDLKPNGLTIPLFTPTSTNDTTGNVGNITRDNDYLYVKTNDNKWKRTKLEDF